KITVRVDSDFSENEKKFELTLTSLKMGRREYVQRWAGLAAQMKPKLSDEESDSMFINTLQPPFFDRMIGNVHSDFRQLIRIGERIENRFGSGKIKKSFANKVIQSDIASEDMEEETSLTEILNQPQTPYFPHASCYTFTNGREWWSRQRKRKSLYDPIPVSYVELLPQLFQRSLLTLIPPKKVEPPYPQGFNPYAKCEYHTGQLVISQRIVIS
ncbi:hypothetical protein Lal_00012240, partial [Lupinus albus]